ncbi:MAG: hypothetical protein ACK587_04735 [Cyanobacteriota bacterium]
MTVISRLYCKKETSGAGSDEVYTAAWAPGGPNIVWNTLTVHIVPGPNNDSNWEDFDSGDVRTNDREVYPSSFTLGAGTVFVALIEKDFGHDFTLSSAETNELEKYLDEKYQSSMTSEEAKSLFRKGIEKFISNDELIGVAKAGADTILKGEGAEYRITWGAS